MGVTLRWDATDDEIIQESLRSMWYSPHSDGATYWRVPLYFQTLPDQPTVATVRYRGKRIAPSVERANPYQNLQLDLPFGEPNDR